MRPLPEAPGKVLELGGRVPGMQPQDLQPVPRGSGNGGLEVHGLPRPQVKHKPSHWGLKQSWDVTLWAEASVVEAEGEHRQKTKELFDHAADWDVRFLLFKWAKSKTAEKADTICLFIYFNQEWINIKDVLLFFCFLFLSET